MTDSKEKAQAVCAPPDTSKHDTSPLADAIMGKVWRVVRSGNIYDTRRAQVAAALRAILDEVLPEYREHHPNTLDERHRKVSVFDVRERFLSIAFELDSQHSNSQ